MKLSIFTEANPLPKTKEEKRYNSFKVSKPYKPLTKEFNTTEELIDIITSYTWSPFVFKEYRLQDDFISVDVIAYDIDDGQKIEDVEKIIHKLDLICLCIPSTSFTPENHRFRIILPMSKTITDPDTYRATYAKYAEYFSVDPSCKDLARYYFGGKLVDGFLYAEGKLLDPVAPEKPVNSPRIHRDSSDRVVVGETIEELVTALYGEPRDKVPEPIAYFLENAPNPDNLVGQWFHSSNSFLFTCGLLGLEQGRIEEVFFSLYPYEELTEEKVAKMIEDGYNSREDVEEWINLEYKGQGIDL